MLATLGLAPPAALLRRVLRHEPLWTEIWSGGIAVVWAVYAYLVVDLDDVASYRPVLDVVPQHCLLPSGLLLGLAQVLCAVLACKPCRWSAALAMTLFWGVLGWGLFLGGAGPAAVLYGGQAVANMASMLLLFRRHAP